LGPGSDVDIVIVVRQSSLPFGRRVLDWDVTQLPVPADVFVYTEDEWGEVKRTGGSLGRETMWVA
jgi:hypothetical protein